MCMAKVEKEGPSMVKSASTARSCASLTGWRSSSAPSADRRTATATGGTSTPTKTTARTSVKSAERAFRAPCRKTKPNRKKTKGKRYLRPSKPFHLSQLSSFHLSRITDILC